VQSKDACSFWYCSMACQGSPHRYASHIWAFVDFCARTFLCCHNPPLCLVRVAGQSPQSRTTDILAFVSSQAFSGFPDVPASLLVRLPAVVSSPSPNVHFTARCHYPSQAPFFGLLDEAEELQGRGGFLEKAILAAFICPATKALLCLRDGDAARVSVGAGHDFAFSQTRPSPTIASCVHRLCIMRRVPSPRVPPGISPEDSHT